MPPPMTITSYLISLPSAIGTKALSVTMYSAVTRVVSLQHSSTFEAVGAEVGRGFVISSFWDNSGEQRITIFQTRCWSTFFEKIGDNRWQQSAVVRTVICRCVLPLRHVSSRPKASNKMPLSLHRLRS